MRPREKYRAAGPPVTVAVVSWNTRDLLRRCLDSLRPDEAAGRVAVCIVDNASSDGSVEMVRADFPWAKLIVSDRNVGFGPAVNAVARAAESTWIAAANADVELFPGGLEALIASGERDDAAAIIAPRLIQPDGRTQHSVHPFPTVGVSLVLQSRLPRLRPDLGDRFCLEAFWDETRPRRVDWAHGAFLLIRRAAFEEVGGFDPRQWMYAEDLDLAWRLARNGWGVRYEPRAAARHAVSAATAPAFGEHRSMRYMAATYAWMVKRRGLLVTWSYAIVNCAGSAFALAFLIPLSAIAPGRWGRLRTRHRRWFRLHRLGLRSRAQLLRYG